MEFLVGDLNVLNAVRQGILAARIVEWGQQRQAHTASITSGIIQTQETAGDFVAQSPRQTDFSVNRGTKRRPSCSVNGWK